jgi:hypothetical protein
MLGRAAFFFIVGGIAVVHAQDPLDRGLMCRIAASEVAGRVAFEGLVFSKAEVAGRYRFEVTKAGPAGSVTSRQGGNFLAKPPASNVLGQMAISLEAGADYKATLMIDAEGRSYSCEASGSVSPR